MILKLLANYVCKTRFARFLRTGSLILIDIYHLYVIMIFTAMVNKLNIVPGPLVPHFIRLVENVLQV